MRVYDDLYGLIEFNSREAQVIDHPLFQRLRHVKQLALADYVFPGGTHSRFSHSLGVCHLITLVADKVLGWKWRGEKEPPRSPLAKLRMAALLHDVGHLPLSHTLEDAYESLLGNANPSEVPEPFKVLCSTESGGGDRRKLHEILSTKIILRLYRDGTLKGHSYQDINNIVLGVYDELRFNQLIHSDLDVDKMDYLLRDAKATGINYGQYNLSYLVHNLRVVGKAPEPVLICVDEKALHTVEHFVLARYFYYLQILYHRKRDIYERLAGACARWMLQAERSGNENDGQCDYLPSPTSLLEWITDGRFAKLDDHAFIEGLRRFAASSSITENQRNICKILIERKKVGILHEERLIRWREHAKWTDAKRKLDSRAYSRRVRDRVRRVLRERQPEDLYTIKTKRKSNLLECDELREVGFSPFVRQAIEFYEHPTRSRASASESGVNKHVIHVAVRDGGKPTPVNEFDHSMIKPLGEHVTELLRYYYCPADLLPDK